MLYVFQVDTGVMMMFEMRLALETVGNLKKAIALKADIPEDKQVLLISGGESLSNTQRVCSYSSAGTDTSPIFLFAKKNIESNQPPLLDVENDDDIEMVNMIESCMIMQPSLDTLVARTELAARLNGEASRLKDACESYVHDQHLQQQGWAAVTANLEDLTRAFKNKSESLLSAFSDFTKCKSDREDLLNKFAEDIKRLDAIPILPTLLEGNKLLNVLLIKSMSESVNITPSKSVLKSTKDNCQDKASIEVSPPKTKSTEEEPSAKPELNTSPQSKEGTTTDTESNATTNEDETKLTSEDEFQDAEPETTIETKAKQTQLDTPDASCSNDDSPTITLRQWIDHHDSNNSLERLIELCWRGLERFTETNTDQIHLEVQEVLKSAYNQSMIEIRGLEERLYGLEKLMVDAKRVVDEQSQLATSFHNNRERFSKIKDSTLLPDLSESHQQQLQMMLNNHKKLSDYKSRCLKAKNELGANLHARLKWIMYVEQQISDLDGKLMIYKENLIRLIRHFEIVQQVYRAPDLYLSSIVEVLRRRRFSRHYLHWASSIAKISHELYENEMNARKEFDSNICGHFLSNLFPGLTKSYPPPFATRQPDPFDTKLPRITAADIQYLQTNLSDNLSKNLFIPRDTPMPHLKNPIKNLDDSSRRDNNDEDEDDRHSSNPTPPSSPTR